MIARILPVVFCRPLYNLNLPGIFVLKSKDSNNIVLYFSKSIFIIGTDFNNQMRTFPECCEMFPIS